MAVSFFRKRKRNQNKKNARLSLRAEAHLTFSLFSRARAPRCGPATHLPCFLSTAQCAGSGPAAASLALTPRPHPVILSLAPRDEPDKISTGLDVRARDGHRVDPFSTPPSLFKPSPRRLRRPS